MPGYIALVLNAHSGSRGTDQADEIAALLGAGGHEVRVTRLDRAESMQTAVDAAVNDQAYALVAGGGDGTVSSAAAALRGHDLPLGVLPLGTLNHFAKDLGLPLDLKSAIEVVLGGHTRKVDLGEVNGRSFLNNSSVGLYPEIVRLRELHPARGFRKWVVALWATLKVLARERVLEVLVTADGTPAVHRTPLLFIANNEYQMGGIVSGTRASLSDGTLAVYVVRTTGLWRLLGLLGRILIGRAKDTPLLTMMRVTAATVSLKRAPVHVALDGEVETFLAPLEYRIRPGALTVLAPQAAAPAPSATR